MSFIHSPKIVTDGLVLALDAANPRSYVSGSTRWYNLANTTISGSLINGPTFDTGSLGSIVLDGTNDQVNISAIPSSVFSLISSSFTVSMWVNIKSNNAGFISSNQSPSNGGQYSLVRRDNVLYVSFYGTPTYTDLGGNRTLPTGSWVNITHVHNNTTQISSLYQQGAFLVSGSMSPSPLITSASLVLGWYGFGGSYLSGSIATTQIYNRALSAQEVQQNYNALRGRYGI
jgi:hypothetical protein